MLLWSLVALAIVASPIFLTACACRSFLYHPTDASPGALAVGGWQAVRLKMTEKVTVSGLVRPPRTESAWWILFFSGNATSLLGSQEVLERMDDGDGHGLAVFAYRGYDGSDGTPTQNGLLHDADRIVQHLLHDRGVAPERLVIVGQSLGSGIAAHAAATLGKQDTPPGGLALLSPYTSMARVFDDHIPIVPVGWVVPDPYRTDALVEHLRAPIVLVHGDADPTIDVGHGRKLAEALGGRARYVELPNVGHDVWAHPRTVEAVRQLLGEVSP